MRARLAKKQPWARSDYQRELARMIAEAMLTFYKARLADRNGKRRLVLRWLLRIDREDLGLLRFEDSPPKRAFDRNRALAEAFGSVSALEPTIRAHVGVRFAEACGGELRHHLDDHDAAEFRSLAVELKDGGGFGALRCVAPSPRGLSSPMKRLVPRARRPREWRSHRDAEPRS